MRLLIFVLIALGLVLNGARASTPGEVLRAIQAAARTNVAAALTLSDKAIAEFPTNAEPLIIRARLLDSVRRYPEAIRDLSVALKLEPTFPSLWQTRGEVNFKAGNFKESVADFDRFIQLVPNRAPHHWQRGISLFYAQRFADGRRQFEQHQTVNPNDVENAVWHFLCVAREQGLTNARANMLKVGADTRIPMDAIYALFAGSGTPDAVLKSASSNAPDSVFYANLYLGLYFEAIGDTVKARHHLTQAAADSGATHYMGDVARVNRKLLGAAGIR